METNDLIRLYNRSLDYLEGRGVVADLEKSFTLNAEAAREGYRNAVFAMGWYYLGGVGVARDLVKARKWYRKSARYGEPKAMFSLGRIALEMEDFDESLTWFKRAAEAGHARSIYWIGKHHWFGHGTRQDRAEALRLFHLAAAKKVTAARRVVKYLSRRNSHLQGSILQQ